MAKTAKHRSTSQTGTPAVTRVASLSVAAAAGIAAVGFGATAAHADDSVWDRVAACESGGNWSINTGNSFYGGLQFTYGTWKGYGGQAYATTANNASRSQQIAIAKRVLYSQGPGAWPVCSVKAGLTRSNGGADPHAMPGGGSGGGGGGSTTPAPAPAPSRPAPSTGTYVTKYVSGTASAYVRSGPGTGYRIVGSLSRGTKVSGTMTNGWLRIGSGKYVGSAVLGGSTSSAPRESAASRSTTRSSLRLSVDGIRGPLTTRAIQRWVGTTQDGILGPITTKALQRKVGAYPDGIWGPKSQAALQTYLGISRDGSSHLNWRTIVALQKHLNSRL